VFSATNLVNIYKMFSCSPISRNYIMVDMHQINLVYIILRFPNLVKGMAGLKQLLTLLNPIKISLQSALLTISSSSQSFYKPRAK